MNFQQISQKYKGQLVISNNKNVVYALLPIGGSDWLPVGTPFIWLNSYYQFPKKETRRGYVQIGRRIKVTILIGKQLGEIFFAEEYLKHFKIYK